MDEFGSPCRCRRSRASTRPRWLATSPTAASTWISLSWATRRLPPSVPCAAICTRRHSPHPLLSSEHDMNLTSSQSFLSLFQLCVAIICEMAACLGALFYFRRVRLERPAIGRFNGRDVLFLFAFLVLLPGV